MGGDVDLKGKAVLVTGAASGLGRATALSCAQKGADLFLVDLNAAGLEATAREITALGVKAATHTADLSKRAACFDAVEAAVKAFAKLDALCNVAGVIAFSHFADTTEAQWEKTLAVNLSAPFYLSQAAIPHLLKSEGAIVNVASSGGLVGEAYLSTYTAAKAGLIHLTKSLAMEFMNQPIRINAVAPGGMATRMAETITMPEGMDMALAQRFMGIRGFVPVEDVADLVRFLASPAARAYHGACLSIDGGITAG